LAALARYAVDGLRGVAETRGLNLETELPEDLPLLAGDPIRLRQMIGNLIENAIKYTPQGGCVRVDAYADQDQVILRVHDTGRGISPADQPYLFDKFYRAGNVSGDTTGTGLGLSIVKSIVDQHHGRVWVESAIGKGSCFTVVLPAAVN
jgi:signal transduction histidine kinase